MAEHPTPVSAIALMRGSHAAFPHLFGCLVMEGKYLASMVLDRLGRIYSLFASVVFLNKTSVKTVGYSSIAHMGLVNDCGFGAYAASMLHVGGSFLL